MRIKSKLLVIYIPILLIGMALTGYWAYLTAYDSVREREYQLLTQTLTLNVLEIIDERRELLIESGLENVPVFREAYQKEVFEELKSLQQATDRHFAISDKSADTGILTMLTCYLRVRNLRHGIGKLPYYSLLTHCNLSYLLLRG